MRNLKRALSLALASVMLLGMMVVGTSASYPDVTYENNEEAIEVLKAVGVMTGDEKGNFNPDKAVTRNEMAVIMTALLDLKTKDYAGSCPLTDVPAWAEPYVAACYANGIVSGTSATTYSGDATVTAAQAALMVMKALGYFQYASDFGDDWMVATVKQASKIDLFKGIDVSATAPLTRNDVAQLVLNTLKATTVEADDNGIGVNPDGQLVSKYKYVEVTKTDADSKYDKIKGKNSENKYTVELGEDLYNGKLELTSVGENGSDDLCRPAHTWKYKGDDVFTAADEADEVVVATKAYVDAKDAYQDKIDEKGDYATGFVSSTAEMINGRAWTSADATSGKYIQPGDIVEFYLNDDGKIKQTVTIRYSLAKVTKVDTKVTKADKEDDVTAYINLETIGGSSVATKIKDTDFAGFSYAKDDVILYVLSGKKVLDSRLADSVEGKVTAKKDDKVAIDGTYYKNVSGQTIKLSAKGTFYLNAAGQVMDFDASSETSDNYAYIYNITNDLGTNSDGVANVATFTAYYVTTDGVKGSAEIDYTKDGNSYYLDSAKTAAYKLGELDTSSSEKKIINTTFTSGVVAFKINSDKEFEMVEANDTINTSATPSTAVDKNNAVIAAGQNANSSTKFIFVDNQTDTSKVKVTVVEGYKNVKIATSDNVTTVTDDGDVLYAFVDNKNGNVEATGYIAVMLDNKAVVTEDDDDTYYEYTVAIDGEETTITTNDTTANTALADLAKGTVFSYNLDGEYVVDVNAAATGITLYTKYVSAANSDYIVVRDGMTLDADGNATYSGASKQYNIGGETVYTITMEYKKDGTTLDTVSVSEGGSYAKKDKVIFTLDDNDLDVVFVIDEIK